LPRLKFEINMTNMVCLIIKKRLRGGLLSTGRRGRHGVKGGGPVRVVKKNTIAGKE
jgi:hypothetical protein